MWTVNVKTLTNEDASVDVVLLMRLSYDKHNFWIKQLWFEFGFIRFNNNCLKFISFFVLKRCKIFSFIAIVLRFQLIDLWLLSLLVERRMYFALFMKSELFSRPWNILGVICTIIIKTSVKTILMGITVIVDRMYFYPPVFYWCNRSFNINRWAFEFLESQCF